MSAILLMFAIVIAQEDFSGPQVDEPLPDCKLKVVLGPQAGKTIQLNDSVEKKPNLVVFVHEVTRPAIGMVRTVTQYAKKRQQDGFVVNVVFLTGDPTDTENWMNRAKRALPQGVNVSISPDGIEGPGSYGLNRKMQVTAVVANEGTVTANFAIVQPSVQADAVKLCQAIAKSLGDKQMPAANDLGIEEQRMQRGDGQYERLMRPFIQKNLTDDQVEKQAAVIEAAAAKAPQLKQRIFEVTRRIISAGKLSNYGTEKAQQYLEKWSKEFGSTDDSTDANKEESDNSDRSDGRGLMSSSKD